MIYATGSKLLQRIYLPHASDDEIDRQHVGAGETLVRVPMEIFRRGQDAIQAFIGTPAHSGVCCVVHKETKRVIDRIIADPELYQHPDGHHIIQSDGGDHGQIWTGERFVDEAAG